MASGSQFHIPPGRSFPLGASLLAGGVNFSVFSKSATALEILLFDGPEEPKPARVVRLDPVRNRTYHYWHAFLPGIGPGQVYAFRAQGPKDIKKGQRFDPEKVLLDPYGKAVAVPQAFDREAAKKPGDNAAAALRSIVIDPSGYDWEGDTPLRTPFARTVIYEMHVGGFTRHPSSGVAIGKRGTYAGLAEKIPYLKDLGITAVELLPVFQFDEQDCPPGLVNYWGYSPISFFAPHRGYSSRKDPLGPLDEFRDLVKALHRAGIEVILDVVYNHTAEGDHKGPVYSFKGLENETYYILEKDRSLYANFTGCGNTFNTNRAIVRRLILDSLRWWVEVMHVDGFRFDLASILTRDEAGRPMESPPAIWDIESDPALAGVKLIAEVWDAVGLFQVGSFPGDSWKEWNARFRDDVRSFVKGDRGSVSRLQARLIGSPDLYSHKEREPEQTINYVTCHDGFTVNDLVSYDRKRNEANGEANRDGSDDNRSWNSGIEGPSVDPVIDKLRNRQVKNLLAINLLAMGTPMILMGDEVRRSQKGNNNAYCQDNETSWLDWTLLENHRDIHRFVQQLIAFRLPGDTVWKDRRLPLNQVLLQAKFDWHGVKLGHPDLGEESRSLAFTALSRRRRLLFHILFNAFWEPLVFELPPAPDGPEGGWRRCMDTFLDPPEDICDRTGAKPVEGKTYKVQPRSVVVLFANVPEKHKAGEEAPAKGTADGKQPRKGQDKEAGAP